MADLERIVHMTPAYDRRSDDPGKNYGIHGVELRMVLKGPLGAVQFVLYTNWQLPHVAREQVARPVRDTLDIEVRFQPLPADVGYHSPKPTYEGQEPMADECEYVNGGTCYYDGSGLRAREMYETMLAGGSDAVWAELEEYYHGLFDADELGKACD